MNALREALLRGRRRPRRSGAGSPMLSRGDGYEFVELRAYVPGDDIRRIDWAATARTATLQTRVVLEDIALTLAAISDTSHSMQSGRARPLLQSAHEALQTWYGAASNEDRCVRVCSEELLGGRALRGTRAAQLCLAAEDGPAFSLTQALDRACVSLPAGTALLVLSDWYDLGESDDLLVRAGTRFDCTALVARDPWYMQLPLRGFVRVRDAESQRSVSLYIGKRERARYTQAVTRREAALQGRLERANWRTGVLDESDGAASLLHAFGLR